MSNIPDIIYIAGYGRSGSTLLERLLQCQPSVHACGEMTNFFKIYGSPSSTCSCGHSLEKCEFWGGIAEELFHQGFSTQAFPYYSRIQKKREAYWSHGGSFFPSKYHNMYANFMQPFCDAVVNQSSGNKTLIDSSKTAYSTLYRPLAISLLGKYRVGVIHLVRDCRGVAWSKIKGRNPTMENTITKNGPLPVTSAMLGWSFSNIAADRLKYRIGRSNYYLLRYEDFVEKPIQSLKKLGAFFQINLDESINVAQKAMEAPGVQLPQMHQLAGNRMRFKTKLQIKADHDWKLNLNHHTAFWIKSILLPLFRKYGYDAI